MIRQKMLLAAGLLMVCVLPASAGLFSSRFDDFKELVLAKQTAAAVLLLREEAEYFGKLKGAEKAFVAAFRNQLELDRFLAFANAGQDDQALSLYLQQKEVLAQLAPDQTVQLNAGLQLIRDRADARLSKAAEALMASLRQDLAATPQWRAAGLAINEGRAALAQHKQSAALASFPSEARDLLERQLLQAEQLLTTNTAAAIAAVDPFTAPSFFSSYPVPVADSEKAGFYDKVAARLEGATAVALEDFQRLYGEVLSAEQKRMLGERYLAAKVPDLGNLGALERIKASLAAARLGFVVPGWKDYALLVTAPVPTDGEVPLSLEPASSIGMRALGFGQAPSDFVQSGAGEGKSLLVFVNVSPVTAREIQQDKRSVMSRFKSGNRQVPNPAYSDAQRQLQSAEASYRQSQASQSQVQNDGSNLAMGMALLSSLSSGMSENAVNEARSQLATTPPYLDETVFSPYNYTEASLRIERKYKVAYAAFDLATQEVRQGQIERGESQDFFVVDNLHPGDPEFGRISQRAKTLADVQGYQRRPMVAGYDGIWADIQAELLK